MLKMPKITIIGVGSVCFGAGTIGDLLYFKDILEGSTIALVDTDQEKLDLMSFLANKLNNDAGQPFKIETSLERRDMLEGSDFVVTSPAIKREELWKKDWEIINGAGIKQTYGENGGPGSLSHTLRNVPLMLSIFRDVEALAPNAWVINFTNPEARICTAIDRYTSLKFVGLCHQIGEAYETVSHVLDIPREDLDIKAAGINHFTWIYDIRRKSTGRGIYQTFCERIGNMPDSFEPMSRKLLDIYGMYPTAGDHHLAEFLSFGWEFLGLAGRDFTARVKEKEEALEWLRGVSSGTRNIEEQLRGRTTESVVDIICAITKGQNQYEVSLDIRNEGCIPNLPNDAIVEVPGVVSGDTVRGLRMAPLPEGIAALLRQQITIQALSVEAAVKGDRKLALQAMLLDPVVDNYNTASNVLDRLLETHKEYISPNFFI
jgi:alpha-galactosidase